MHLSNYVYVIWKNFEPVVDLSGRNNFKALLLLSLLLLLVVVIKTTIISQFVSKMHTYNWFLCNIVIPVPPRQSRQSWQSCARSPWGEKRLGVPSSLFAGTLQSGSLSSLHSKVLHLSKKVHCCNHRHVGY